MKYLLILVAALCFTTTADAGIFCGNGILGRGRRLERRADRQAARASCGSSAGACAACQVP